MASGRAVVVFIVAVASVLTIKSKKGAYVVDRNCAFFFRFFSLVCVNCFTIMRCDVKERRQCFYDCDVANTGKQLTLITVRVFFQLAIIFSATS